MSVASPVAALILAAGKGTRMKSDLPKGLHPVCGLPMVEHVARALRGAGVERPIVVIGHGGEKMQAALGDGYGYAWQTEQLGTGHAAMMAEELLADYDGPVIVAAGDTPMLGAETFTALLNAHIESGAKATLATSVVDDPQGYGRIVRDADGKFAGIVEQKDATPEQRAIREVNAGLYIFDSKALFRILPELKSTNAQGEYYITDVPAVILTEGGTVEAKVFDDPDLLVGVNDRWQLAQVDSTMRKRILRQHALNGVSFLDIESVWIGVDVTIGVDTIVEPQTMICGKTSIGKGCHIGPFTRIEDSVIGDNTSIVASYVKRVDVGNDVWAGPYAHLRPETVLGDHARIGNFVEIKKATMGEGAKANHLTYIGDASVGANTNVGAGTITSNYDGYGKYRTEIGANTFIGSNSTLIAPVTIGDGAFITAGSVITHDVPSDAMAFGRARQETKEGKAAEWREAKKSTKRTN